MFRLISKTINSTERAAGILALLTIGSTLLGIVRERLLATMIGPGPIVDAYVAAFKSPDTLYALAASLVSVSILLPYLNKAKDNKESQQVLLDNILSTFSYGMVIACILLFIIMRPLSYLFVPGFDDTTRELMISMSRIMLLSPVFLGISNIFNSVSQLHRKFIAVALSPVLYNLGIVVGILIGYPLLGPTGLAYGVVIGTILHLCIHIPIVRSTGIVPRFVRTIDWKQVLSIFRVSVPRTLSLSMSQLTMIGLVALASHMIPGSVSLLNFAFVIQNVPVVLIGMSISVASFSALVSYAEQRQFDLFARQVIQSLRLIIITALPLTILFVILRSHIVRVLLGAGQFDWNHTKITAALLGVLVLSIVGQSAVQLGTRAYYALGRTWRPFLQNTISLVVTLSIAYVLIRNSQTPFMQNLLGHIARDIDVVGRELILLGVAYTIGTLFNTFSMWIDILLTISEKSLVQKLFRVILWSLVATGVLALVTYAVLQIFAPIHIGSTVATVFVQGLLSGGAGLLSAGMVLYVARVPELRQITQSVARKLRLVR